MTAASSDPHMLPPGDALWRGGGPLLLTFSFAIEGWTAPSRQGGRCW